MTDDRETNSGGVGSFGAPDPTPDALAAAGNWDGVLNGAFSDLMFGGSHPAAGAGLPASPGASFDDALHAAFDAMLFGDGAGIESTSTNGCVRVWVANDDTAPAGFGRIMLAHEVGTAPLGHLPGLLDGTGPQITANPAIASGRAANDNALWIGASDGLGGVYGRDPSAAQSANGDTLIAWIGDDDCIHAALLTAAETPDGAAALADRNQLEALLQDANDDVANNGGKPGRVVITPASNNSFAALWTCEFALNSVLMGKLLTLSPAAKADDGTEGGAERAWTAHDIPPVSAPAHASGFEVALHDVGTLSVTFAGDDANEDGGHVTTLHFGVNDDAGDGSGDAGGFALANLLSDSGGAAPTARPTPPLTVSDDDARAAVTSDPADIVNAATGGDGASSDTGRVLDSTGPDGLQAPVVETFTIAGDATDTVQQTQPDVAVAANGQPTALHVVGDGKPGEPVTVVITPLDAHGHAATAPVVVTENAISSYADAPSLDAGPAITGTGDGVAVSWVEQEGSGDGTVTTLQVQAFDDGQQPLSAEPLTVATSHGEKASFSDVATGYTACADDGTTAQSDEASGNGAAPADNGGILAVAWVENANSDGYGAIKGQLFAVPGDDEDKSSGSGGGLTPLGADGVADGGCDEAFNIGNVGSGNIDAIGRGPQVEGLGSGSIAVAWVEPPNATGAGDGDSQSGHETVHGAILTPGGDTQPVVIDLTPLMPQGIAEGTNPVLTSDAAGDLIVGWLQAALCGGFEAAAAVYKHDSDGKWLPPEVSHILNHFDEVPKDFAIAVAGSGDDISLVLAWRDEDNNVNGISYDVSAGHSGPEFTIHEDTDHNDGGGLGIATIPDGEMLVVYATNDGQDSDIAAARVDILSVAPVADGAVDATVQAVPSGLPAPPAVVVEALPDDAAPTLPAPAGACINNSPVEVQPVEVQAVEQAVDIPESATAPAVAAEAPPVDCSDNSGSGSDSSGSSSRSSNSGSGSSGSGKSGSGKSGSNSESGSNSGSGSESKTEQRLQDAQAGSDQEGSRQEASEQTSSYDECSDGTPSAVVSYDHDVIFFAGEDATAEDAAAVSWVFDTGGSETTGLSAAPSPDTSDPGLGFTVAGMAALEALSMPHVGDSGQLEAAQPPLAPAGNDNTAPDFGDEALSFAGGYGNDIGDYLTAEEQAETVPEPIALLFEALQFANAFDDVANSNVLIFDTSNVVTISQFQAVSSNDPKYDVPLT